MIFPQIFKLLSEIFEWKFQYSRAEIQIPKTKTAQQEGPSAHRETEKFTATQYSE
jgi:hypothetical protein